MSGNPTYRMSHDLGNAKLMIRQFWQIGLLKVLICSFTLSLLAIVHLLYYGGEGSGKPTHGLLSKF